MQNAGQMVVTQESRSRMDFRRIFRKLLTLHGSPEDIALGTAVGFFVAFTPTLGFQIIIAIIVATCIGTSRPAALIPIWITNVFTAVPIYAACYFIGSPFYSGPSPSEVYERLEQTFASLNGSSIYDVEKPFEALLELGVDIFIPMAIGGILIGLVCAFISYPITLRAVRRYQHRKHEKAESHAKWPE